MEHIRVRSFRKGRVKKIVAKVLVERVNLSASEKAENASRICRQIALRLAFYRVSSVLLSRLEISIKSLSVRVWFSLSLSTILGQCPKFNSEKLKIKN